MDKAKRVVAENPSIPWSGKNLEKVTRLHEQGREMLESYTMPDDIQASGLRYHAPMILADDKGLSERVRPLINIFNIFPQNNHLLLTTYLWGALIDESIGEDLSDVLWTILSLGAMRPGSPGGNASDPDIIYYKHLLYPLLPGSQGTGDILTPLSATPPQGRMEMDYHSKVLACFHGRIPLAQQAVLVMNKTGKENYAIELGIPLSEENNRELAQVLLKYWRSITKDTLVEFASLVQEYNVEWAMAATEWGKGSEKP